MLDALCSDIKQIVYKYVFEYHYQILIKEYQQIWLRYCSLKYDQIYWADGRDCFVNDHRGVANYRNLQHITLYRPAIVKFNNVCAFIPAINYISLPKRYQYSGLQKN